MKIRPVGIELFRADGQTHIYDEADYQIAFSDFANCLTKNVDSGSSKR